MKMYVASNTEICISNRQKASIQYGYW